MNGTKTEKIYSKEGDLLAIILRSGDYPEGLNFYNKEEDFIQLGTWKYQKGQKIKGHNHLIFERAAQRTQEAVYLKSGKIKSGIYDEQDNLMENIILTEDDIIVFLAGGHDFEILEDNTQVFEVKNGPYAGVEKDKRKFYEK